MFPDCVCGSKLIRRTRVVQGIGGESTVLTCDHCGLSRWEAPDSFCSMRLCDDYKPGGRNDYSSALDQMGDFNAGVSSPHNMGLVTKICRLGNGPTRLLDCGCSLGYLLGGIRMERPEWDLCGIEINPAYALYARQQGFDVFEGAIEEALPGSGLFNMVVLTEVFEHLLDPLMVLSLIRKILVPGGYLIATVPNLHSVMDLHVLKNRSALSIPYQHLWFYTRQSLATLVRECGFTVTRCDTISFFGARGKGIRRYIGKGVNPILDLLNIGGTIFLVAQAGKA